MLHRPPSRPPSPREKRQRRREQWRLAQARRRARVKQHVDQHRVRIGEIAHEALKMRNLDAGMPMEQAERATRDRNKVRIDLEQIIAHWALTYLRERRQD